MTNSNLNIVLANAQCCSAIKAVELSDLLSNGSKCVNKKIKELKILNDSIESLKCYGFSNNSIFNYSLLCSSYDNLVINIAPLGTTFYAEFVTNTETKTYTFDSDGISTYQSLYLSFFYSTFEGINYVISDCGLKNGVFTRTETLTLDCNVVSIYSHTLFNGVMVTGSERIYIVNKAGKCPSCLTIKQVNKLISNILKICKICDCQIN